ncbi:MAG TPA: NADPH-dependent glutamate synthase [Bacteroidales bacterium]|nr:NADPH-dependent glutamate synthase [Bacteroidales bacterium]HQB21159.1 NADPH-dependent glutamate synthase [Bacteroidales bacterium]
MSTKIPRVPVREQAAQERIKNFEEVSYGYNAEEAVLEAHRCIQCKNPRCVKACPVQIKIPEFILAVKNKDFAQAADIIAEDSSLPAICGRVCPQESQCEGSCVLGVKGEPVNIGKLERFVADWGRKENYYNPTKVSTNGFKVAVIGSGPAGLACATDLAKLGYQVKIFEALHLPGGVLEYGIPEFRLPKEEVVRYEINNVKKLGVEIETNVIVGRTITIDDLLDKEGYHAIFLGSGAGLPKFMNIPGENLNGVVSANEFLTRSNLMKAFDPEYDTPIYVGKRVAVVGGGNVAMDAARVARRLGAEVYLVYRRSEKELPARVEEVHHAKEEGIIFKLLNNPVEILGNEKGWVTGMRCIEMGLGEPDESGRRRPIPIKGSEFNIECDVVIMSLGTSPNPLIASTTPNLNTEKWGGIIIDENTCQTSREGVFAGGDNVTGAATVILAMGAGRKAAEQIDVFIKNKFGKK